MTGLHLPALHLYDHRSGKRDLSLVHQLARPILHHHLAVHCRFTAISSSPSVTQPAASPFMSHRRASAALD